MAAAAAAAPAAPPPPPPGGSLLDRLLATQLEASTSGGGGSGFGGFSAGGSAAAARPAPRLGLLRPASGRSANAFARPARPAAPGADAEAPVADVSALLAAGSGRRSAAAAAPAAAAPLRAPLAQPRPATHLDLLSHHARDDTRDQARPARSGLGAGGRDAPAHGRRDGGAPPPALYEAAAADGDAWGMEEVDGAAVLDLLMQPGGWQAAPAAAVPRPVVSGLLRSGAPSRAAARHL